MTQPLRARPAPQPIEIPKVPPAEIWRAWTPEARERFIAAATEALTRQAELMGEGRPHSRARHHILGTLGDFVQRVGRDLYLASDMPVLYPGEECFAPDLMAVRDVPDPGDADTRMVWDVANEGLGLDLAIEVLYNGDRDKDLVRNVAWFARLGIPEYFVYDRRRQRLYGYRLWSPDSERYRSINTGPRGMWSEVLGLGLGILDERLRFFHEDGAVVPESIELLDRANQMLSQIERRVEEEATARAQAEAAQVQAETRISALEAEIASLRARLGEG